MSHTQDRYDDNAPKRHRAELEIDDDTMSPCDVDALSSGAAESACARDDSMMDLAPVPETELDQDPEYLGPSPPEVATPGLPLNIVDLSEELLAIILVVVIQASGLDAAHVSNFIYLCRTFEAAIALIELPNVWLHFSSHFSLHSTIQSTAFPRVIRSPAVGTSSYDVTSIIGTDVGADPAAIRLGGGHFIDASHAQWTRFRFGDRESGMFDHANGHVVPLHAAVISPQIGYDARLRNMLHLLRAHHAGNADQHYSVLVFGNFADSTVQGPHNLCSDEYREAITHSVYSPVLYPDGILSVRAGPAIHVDGIPLEDPDRQLSLARHFDIPSSYFTPFFTRLSAAVRDDRISRLVETRHGMARMLEDGFFGSFHPLSGLLTHSPTNSPASMEIFNFCRGVMTESWPVCVTRILVDRYHGHQIEAHIRSQSRGRMLEYTYVKDDFIDRMYLPERRSDDDGLFWPQAPESSIIRSGPPLYPLYTRFTAIVGSRNVRFKLTFNVLFNISVQEDRNVVVGAQLLTMDTRALHPGPYYISELECYGPPYHKLSPWGDGSRETRYWWFRFTVRDSPPAESAMTYEVCYATILLTSAAECMEWRRTMGYINSRHIFNSLPAWLRRSLIRRSWDRHFTPLSHAQVGYEWSLGAKLPHDAPVIPFMHFGANYDDAWDYMIHDEQETLRRQSGHGAFRVLPSGPGGAAQPPDFPRAVVRSGPESYDYKWEQRRQLATGFHNTLEARPIFPIAWSIYRNLLKMRDHNIIGLNYSIPGAEVPPYLPALLYSSPPAHSYPPPSPALLEEPSYVEMLVSNTDLNGSIIDMQDNWTEV